MNTRIHNALTDLAAAYRAVSQADPGTYSAARANDGVRAALQEVNASLGDHLSPWRVAFAGELKRYPAWRAVFTAWDLVERGSGSQGSAAPRPSKPRFQSAFAGAASPGKVRRP